MSNNKKLILSISLIMIILINELLIIKLINKKKKQINKYNKFIYNKIKDIEHNKFNNNGNLYHILKINKIKNFNNKQSLLLLY